MLYSQHFAILTASMQDRDLMSESFVACKQKLVCQTKNQPQYYKLSIGIEVQGG